MCVCVFVCTCVTPGPYFGEMRTLVQAAETYPSMGYIYTSEASNKDRYHIYIFTFIIIQASNILVKKKTKVHTKN